MTTFKLRDDTATSPVPLDRVRGGIHETAALPARCVTRAVPWQRRARGGPRYRCPSLNHAAAMRLGSTEDEHIPLRLASPIEPQLLSHANLRSLSLIDPQFLSHMNLRSLSLIDPQFLSQMNLSSLSLIEPQLLLHRDLRSLSLIDPQLPLASWLRSDSSNELAVDAGGGVAGSGSCGGCGCASGAGAVWDGVLRRDGGGAGDRVATCTRFALVSWLASLPAPVQQNASMISAAS
jgi:hypothetical protein